MVCAHCGADLPSGQDVCGRCGHRSVEADAEAVTSFSPLPAGALPSGAPTGLASDGLTIAPGTPAEGLTIGPDSFDGATIAPEGRTPRPEPDTHAHPAIVSGHAQPRPSGPFTPPGQASATGLFQTGTPFGRRYHLIRQLGAGGMGAVYQAWDEELAVVVAIKVIRPEAMADPAAARDLEKRFKRELLLARNVTHKNVVRIHDLGEVEGVKYITMPYVNGADLATILDREKKLPVPRALAIARQVAAGLVAAHDAGVVHRDLKPGNILLDEDEHALITDFGIARSISGPGGGTVVGTVVGTLDYMAPEQARAEAVDHRADIYAFGLILSDMLIGRRKVGAGSTALANLLDRISKPPTSIRGVDQSIPQELDDIVLHCVQTDPALRYQRTQELLIALEAASGESAAPSPSTRHYTRSVPAAQPRTITIALPSGLTAGGSRKWVAAGLTTVALAGGGYAVYRAVSAPKATNAPTASAPVPTGQSVSLAILPFRNASGDSSLDGLGSSLAEMLGTTIGQSAALKSIPGGRVSQILSDLRIAPDSTLDPSALSRLAELSGADTIMWGQFVKFGSEIRIDATVQDVKHQRTIPLKAQAANERDLFGAIERLSASVRENLALSNTAVKELAATSFKPTTDSMASLRSYTEGRNLMRQGRYLEAQKKLEASVQEDPQFALGYSKLAEVYFKLGYDGESERSSRLAVGYADSLPPVEKHFIVGSRARMQYDLAKGLDQYETLDKLLPQNDDVLLALGELYEDSGAYDKSRQRFKALLARDPGNLEALVGAGRVEFNAGRPNDALAYLTPALTQTIQAANDEGKAGVLWALGVTYFVLNKPDDALRNYQQALEIERRIGRKRGIADNLKSIAQLQDDRGQSEQALKSYSDALAIRREIGDKRGAGDVLLDMGTYYWARGRYDEALARFKEALQVQREVHNQPYEALALNNIGAVYLSTGRYDDARTHLEGALALRERMNTPSDTAETLHNLGDIALKSGSYDGALDRYLKALNLRRQIGDKRGTAIEQYSMGLLFEYQGRFGAAIESRSEARKSFAEIGDKSVWMARALLGEGSALGQGGRFDDAQKTLSDAMALAREIKNDELVAQILNLQGNLFAYRGDLAGARRLYEQASQSATRLKLREVALQSRVNLAMVAVKEKRAQPTAAALHALQAEAEQLGLKYESVQCQLLAGEVALDRKQPEEAKRELEAGLEQADRVGSLTLGAIAHHLLARAARQAADGAEVRRHEERVGQLLRQIQEQARGRDVLQRADLKGLTATSST